MNKLFFFPPPLVALLLICAAYIANRGFLNLEVVPATTGGIVWAATGLALSISAALQFRQLHTTVMPHGTPVQLVTLGAYLWTRNPMYLGILTALIGLAFYQGTLAFWLVPPGFFLIINRFHIPYEEAKLMDLFGKDYKNYRHSVRRWL
jgi:protein-S-isoprenylcysteine O-methyltransferase Ste14